MTVAINKNELKLVIKETVRETLLSEMMKLRAFLSPYVSSREQKNIERLYGKPIREIKKSLKFGI